MSRNISTFVKLMSNNLNTSMKEKQNISYCNIYVVIEKIDSNKAINIKKEISEFRPHNHYDYSIHATHQCYSKICQPSMIYYPITN